MAKYAELTPREREELRERWEHSDTVSAWMAVSVIEHADRLREALERIEEAAVDTTMGALADIAREALGPGSEGANG